jgi:hypothetical protein
MSKIRQIDYTTPRTLVSYSGKRTVRMTGQENRYKFSGGTPVFFAFLQSRRSAADSSFSNYGT